MTLEELKKESSHYYSTQKYCIRRRFTGRMAKEIYRGRVR